MGLFSALRGYFSCPWTSFILCFILLLEAVGSVFFIADLPLFWRRELQVSDKTTSMINYGYGLVSNFGVFGVAVLTDNFFGRFSITAFHFVLMILGFGLLACAVIEELSGSVWALVLGGCAYITLAFSFGIMRAIYPAFTADQFKDGVHSPESRERMFSWLYLLLNIAAVVALVVINPFLPGLIEHFVSSMILSVIGGLLFIACSYWFVKAPRTKNVVTKAIACVFCAIFNKGKMETEEDEISEQSKSFVNIFRSTSMESPKEVEPQKPKLTGMFLDRAHPKYDLSFLLDVRQVLSVSWLLIVGIPFWLCLRYSQAIWYFHNIHVDNHIGSFTSSYFVIASTNALGCIFFVLFFTLAVYPFMNFLASRSPALKKIFAVTPMRKMGFGAIMSVACFSVAIGAESLILENALPPLAEDALVVLWSHQNLPKCDVTIGNIKTKTVESNKIQMINMTAGTHIFNFYCADGRKKVTIQPGVNVIGIFPQNSTYLLDLRYIDYKRVEDDFLGNTNYTLLTCKRGRMTIEGPEEEETIDVHEHFNISTKFFEERKRTLKVKGNIDFELDPFHLHGAHVLLFDNNPSCKKRNSTPDDYVPTDEEEKKLYQTFEIISPHKLSMWWVIAEAVTMAIAEVTIGIGAMEFAYAETAPSMKTVMQAMWFVMAAFGFTIGIIMEAVSGKNLTKIITATSLMVIGTLHFLIFSYLYTSQAETYLTTTKNEEEEVEESLETAEEPSPVTAESLDTPWIGEEEKTTLSEGTAVAEEE